MVIVFTVTKYKMSQKILNISNLLEDWTMNSNLPTTSSFMAKHRNLQRHHCHVPLQKLKLLIHLHCKVKIALTKFEVNWVKAVGVF